MDISIIPKYVLDELREYFTSFPIHNEKGAIVTKDWKIIKIKNVSSNPEFLIEQDDETAIILADLLDDNNVFCWAHSHPFISNVPSTIDIKHHIYGTNMLIWSGVNDSFALYSNDEVLDMRKKI